MKNSLCSFSTIKLPTQWYNIIPELPGKLPGDIDSAFEADKIQLMQRIRVKELSRQDQSMEKFIDIPPDVLEMYNRVGRPTPLMRAYELEEYLGTPAQIYIKREDVMPTHSFKLNSAIAQTFYAKKEGFQGVVTESGAGQWGLALSYAASLNDLSTQFFWVKVSREQKPVRAEWCKMFGATIYDSPSTLTMTGRNMLEQDANCPGSLGISIGEAIEFTSEHPEYAYVSGSNLCHVILHQTIIGLELKQQLKQAGIKPDSFVACCGGGSNLGGFMGPFIFDDEFNKDTRFVAIESDAAPRLTKGEYKYDSADPYGLTPQSKSYTLGKDFIPVANHVGGLRQHNGSPIIGALRNKGLLDAVAYSQREALEAGLVFTKLYGAVPAPESSHALKGTIDLALKAKEENRNTTIVMCLSGSGVLDMSAYMTLNN
ncbi:TrpB-like pyridoxal phosphate-dependent enzyme [Paenibacillus sp. NPDC057934]|uniref:TrpB-like pyridoxal phosphate-dependent enzyme n=1 Tax=Paenibacillus sp. NPDC057934 TaxID=3346282 RepID=UPI0036D828DD